MKRVSALIENNEDWLLQRIIGLAKERGYTQYSSTLEEAWRIMVRGLSKPLISFLDGTGKLDETAFAFALKEARLHRARGVILSDFVDLLKCCYQAYRELLHINLTNGGIGPRGILAVEKYFGYLEDKVAYEFTRIDSDSLIYEMQKQNRELTNEKNRFLTIFESLFNPVMYFNQNNELCWMNRAARELIGDMGGMTSTYYTTETFIDPPDWLLPTIIKFRSAGHNNAKYPIVLETMSGDYRHFEARLSHMADVSGKYTGTIVNLNDFTDYQRTKNKLRLAYSQLYQLLRSVPDGLIVISPDFIILNINDGLAHWLGSDPHDLVGQKCFDFIKIPECKTKNCFLKQVAGGISVPESEREIIGADGVKRYTLMTVVPLHDADENFAGIVQSIKDISDRVQAEKEIHYLVFHDKLTGLYNRTYLDKKLKDVEPDEFPYSIIMGDLNGLKVVNDAFGYKTGDKLLIEMAKILRESCRSADVIIRSGGDEFVILLPGADEMEALSVIKRIKKGCEESTFQPFQPSISLGLAVKTTSGENIFSVFRDAETKMYQRKMLEADSSPGFSIQSLQQMLHEKSNETEEHTERLRTLARLLGQELGLSEAVLVDLDLLAALHDIGKIAIPDKILNKPGRLTDAEWKIMKRHSEIGYRIAKTSPVLAPIAEYILAHHEHWDGRGYPRGLAKEQIPLPARILAVADAYDVMVNERSYKSKLTPEQAIDELKKCSGSQFDPKVVSAFISLFQKSD